jgi:hypothetical protein
MRALGEDISHSSALRLGGEGYLGCTVQLPAVVVAGPPPEDP